MEYGASNLRERVAVLELQSTEGGWDWAPVRKTWAGVEVTGKSNLFSKVGVGARDAALALRKQPLTLHNAIRWRGEHLFLTSIVENKPGWLDVRAARVEAVMCRAEVQWEPPGGTFPAVLTEKYLRHEQLEPMALNTLTYVLVTPKPVVLSHGGLVEADGRTFEVLVGHTLDPYKNEYEITRREEP